MTWLDVAFGVGVGLFLCAGLVFWICRSCDGSTGDVDFDDGSSEEAIG